MAAVDQFAAYSGSLTGPATHAETVTPHDVTELTYVTRYLHVGSAGNVAVLMADGTTATLLAVAAGTTLPIRVKRVNDTDTTASNMVGLS